MSREEVAWTQTDEKNLADFIIMRGGLVHGTHAVTLRRIKLLRSHFISAKESSNIEYIKLQNRQFLGISIYSPGLDLGPQFDVKVQRRAAVREFLAWHRFRVETFIQRFTISNPSGIARPPGSIPLEICELVYNEKTYNEVFVETIHDMREEYYKALALEDPWKRKWKIRFVRIRGYGSVVSAVFAHMLSSALGQLIGSLKFFK